MAPAETCLQGVFYRCFPHSSVYCVLGTRPYLHMELYLHQRRSGEPSQELRLQKSLYFLSLSYLQMTAVLFTVRKHHSNPHITSFTQQLAPCPPTFPVQGAG